MLFNEWKTISPEFMKMRRVKIYCSRRKGKRNNDAGGKFKEIVKLRY